MNRNALKQYLCKLHQTFIKLNLSKSREKKEETIEKKNMLTNESLCLFSPLLCPVFVSAIECGKSQKNISVGDNTLFHLMINEWNDGNDNQYSLRI